MMNTMSLSRQEAEMRINIKLDSSTSESSLAIHQRSYIRPECGESSAESAERHREIDTRVNENMRHRLQRRAKTNSNNLQRRQYVQELTLDDINPHGLYANPVKPLSNVSVDIIFDTGACVNQLPAEYTQPWCNLRSTCLTLTGAFTNDCTL
jgi:hypothetical protein